MDLFAVKRYDADRPTNDPEREKQILAKLQKNIAKNRKKLLKRQPKLSENETEAQPVIADNENENEIQKESEEPLDESMQVDEVQATNEPQQETSKETFMVLGNDKFQSVSKVNMMLPPWLAHPTIISNDLSIEATTPIDNLPYISNEVKDIVKKMGVTSLFPVQSETIPWILSANSKPTPFRPRDVCVSAPTGSGKTLAYAIPIVQMLLNRVERKVRALIVLPVNELAVQVLKVFKKLCENTQLNCVLLTKFVPFQIEQFSLVGQCDEEYYSKADIVVSTTGRLVEHIHSTKGFSLRFLKFLVMDEADRIMEQIQNNWLYHLDRHVKEESDSVLSGRAIQLCYRDLCREAVKQPQKMLFSATLSQDPEKLQNLQLFQPKLFTTVVRDFVSNDSNQPKESSIRGDFIGKFTTPAELTEKFCITEAELKPLTLFSLIKENKWNRFLCFTNSGESAHRLSFILQQLFGDELKIEELSSGLQLNIRSAVLEKFKIGKVNGLVCSDSLARGIDIQGVDIVISYNIPRHINTYIHRIGRTARAGRPGLAVTLATGDELKDFNKVISEAGKSGLDEIKVTSNIEEMTVKEFRLVVSRLQDSLKREKHVHTLKAIQEKNKLKQTGNIGVLGQLQSQVLHTSLHTPSERNIPESWKFENQLTRNVRKEKKFNLKKKRNQKKKTTV